MKIKGKNRNYEPIKLNSFEGLWNEGKTIIENAIHIKMFTLKKVTIQEFSVFFILVHIEKYVKKKLLK